MFVSLHLLAYSKLIHIIAALSEITTEGTPLDTSEAAEVENHQEEMTHNLDTSPPTDQGSI